MRSKLLSTGFLALILGLVSCGKSSQDLLLGQWQNVQYRRIIKSDSTESGFDTILCSRPMFLDVSEDVFRVIDFNFNTNYLRQETALWWEIKDKDKLVLFDRDSRDEFHIAHLSEDSLTYYHNGAEYAFQRQTKRPVGFPKGYVDEFLRHNIFYWDLTSSEEDSSQYIEFFSDFYIFPTDQSYPLRAWRSDTIGNKTFLFLEEVEGGHFPLTIELENWSKETWQARFYNIDKHRFQPIQLRQLNKMPTTQRDSIHQQLIGRWILDAFALSHKGESSSEKPSPNNQKRHQPEQLQFNSDGTFEHFQQNQQFAGTWRQSQTGNLILTQLEGQVNHQYFSIEEISQDTLIALTPQKDERSVAHGLLGRARFLKISTFDKMHKGL